MQGNLSKVSCRGMLGCTQGPGALSACLAASHPHPHPPRSKGSPHPLVRSAARPDYQVPCSFLITLFWGPSCGGRGQGEGANINSVCAGVQTGFVQCSEDQG